MIATIDKHIPPPTLPSQTKWPWALMRKGDSFFAPNYGTAGNKEGLPQLTTQYAKRLHPGSEWQIRSVTENGVRGLRVWRTK